MAQYLNFLGKIEAKNVILKVKQHKQTTHKSSQQELLSGYGFSQEDFLNFYPQEFDAIHAQFQDHHPNFPVHYG